MKKTFKLFAVLFCLTGLFMACQDDDRLGNTGGETTGAPGVYAIINNPTRSNFSTRANVVDLQLDTLYAVYFKRTSGVTAATTDKDYTYISHEKLSPTFNSLKDSLVSRLAEAPKSAAKNRKDIKVVFISNVQGGTLFNGISTTPLTNVTLKEYRESLIITQTDHIALWDSVAGGATTAGYVLATSATKDAIPMYACSDSVYIPTTGELSGIYYINEETAPNSKKYKYYNLVRMMAKFTLLNKRQTKAELAAISSDVRNFKIDSVAVVNGFSAGNVCHLPTQWHEASNRVDTINIKAVNNATYKGKRSTDLNNSTRLANWIYGTGSIVTNNWGSDTQTGTQKIVFYTFEADTVSRDLGDKDNLYILLVGTRLSVNASGHDENVDAAGVKKHYMLPVMALKTRTAGNATTASGTLDKDGDNKYYAGPVLRNHHYYYTISGVDKSIIRAAMKIAPWTDVDITDYNPIPLR